MRKMLIAAAGTLSVAAAVVGVGLTSASAAPSAPRFENFQFVSSNAVTMVFTAIASGDFTAGGTFNASANPGTLTFPNGTFEADYTITQTRQYTNPTTCLFTRVRTETYTLSDGTGAYAGIQGSGKAISRTLAILASDDGVCSTTLPPVTYEGVIDAHGPVSIPTPTPTPTKSAH
jgi:hypothetical protein